MRGLTLATEPFEVLGANLGCVFKKIACILLIKNGTGDTLWKTTNVERFDRIGTGRQPLISDPVESRTIRGFSGGLW